MDQTECHQQLVQRVGLIDHQSAPITKASQTRSMFGSEASPAVSAVGSKVNGLYPLSTPRLQASGPRLMGHISRKYGRKRSEPCNICNKTFNQLSCLKRHVYTVHEGKRSKPCKICHKTFFDSSKLSRHISTVHGGERSKPSRKSRMNVFHHRTPRCNMLTTQNGKSADESGEATNSTPELKLYNIRITQPQLFIPPCNANGIKRETQLPKPLLVKTNVDNRLVPTDGGKITTIAQPISSTSVFECQPQYNAWPQTVPAAQNDTKQSLPSFPHRPTAATAALSSLSPSSMTKFTSCVSLSSSASVAVDGHPISLLGEDNGFDAQFMTTTNSLTIPASQIDSSQIILGYQQAPVTSTACSQLLPTSRLPSRSSLLPDPNSAPSSSTVQLSPSPETDQHADRLGQKWYERDVLPTPATDAVSLTEPERERLIQLFEMIIQNL